MSLICQYKHFLYLKPRTGIISDIFRLGRVIHVEVVWVVTPCGVVVGYKRFGGPYCLHLRHRDSDNKNKYL
jgi:hypothetical protein